MGRIHTIRFNGPREGEAYKLPVNCTIHVCTSNPGALLSKNKCVDVRQWRARAHRPLNLTPGVAVFPEM